MSKDAGTGPTADDPAEPRVDSDRPVNPDVAAYEVESNPLKRAAVVLGPGLITGASDDDPSGIATYAQTGARYGYTFLWTTVAMLPMMISIQYICARIGLVTGKGLAEVFRQRYPRWVLYPVVLAMVVANTANAGADIGAIAAALNMIIPIRAVVFVIPIGVIIVLVQVFGSYGQIARIGKWLTLALLAYIGAAFFARPDLGAVLQGSLIPSLGLDAGSIGILVALLGTTISPYLFFWQTSQEVEGEIDIGRKRLWQRQGSSDGELRFAFWDTVAGMTFSEIVAFFIILTTAATLHVSGKTDIQSATDAAQALRPIAGDASAILLGVGLIGSGMLAVPILTASAAYGVADAFGWRSSLDSTLRRAPQFYAAIIAATVIGMSIDFLGINPFTALVATAMLNGLLAPVILVLVMRVSSDRAVMGERTSGRLLRSVGWATTLVMAVAAVALLVTAVLPGAG